VTAGCAKPGPGGLPGGGGNTVASVMHQISKKVGGREGGGREGANMNGSYKYLGTPIILIAKVFLLKLHKPQWISLRKIRDISLKKT
jgi:hypothetical protein